MVVSSVTGNIRGVIQYNHGKIVQDGNFKQTKSLNRLPEVLRQAVADLYSTYRLKHSQFAEYLV